MSDNMPESSSSEDHSKWTQSMDICAHIVDDYKLAYAEHSSNWLKSVKAFVKETQTIYLNLESRGIGVSEVKSILEFLSGSQVSKLSLEGNSLRGGMKSLSKLLAETKLKKLNLRSCDLSKKDILYVMEVLKFTQISSLDISNNATRLTENEVRKVTSLLVESRLPELKFPITFFNAEFVPLFLEALPDTSLVCLDLTNAILNFSCIESLFFSMCQTSIVNLNLSNLKINHNLLTMLFKKLKDSKIERLNLSQNDIDDELMDLLAENLEQSCVTDLNLSKNEFSGANDFVSSLKCTKIRILNISGNSIVESRMFGFPNFLKETSIVELNISHCSLMPEIWEELVKSLKFTELSRLIVGECKFSLEHFYDFVENLSCANIERVIFSCNSLPPAGPINLTKYVKAARLKLVDVNLNFAPSGGLKYFERFKNSPIISVKILGSCYSPSHLITSLMSTTLSCLDLSSVQLGDYVTNLAAHLKLTAIKHLLLCGNEINDMGAEAMAKCLKETKIVELDLSQNSIKNSGAKALAYSLKNSQLRHLRLNGNKIGISGFRVLAEQSENTCVTVLDVFSNPGNYTILIDKVLWENRVLTYKLVKWFGQIAPETFDNSLCFNRTCDNLDVSLFLEDCLIYYKMIIEQPAAISILEEEKSIPFSKAEIFYLMSEKFPEQFSWFIGTCLQANLAQHIDFLKRAEELQLSKLVELLLLNRPIYTIEVNQNILHPYVYHLLHKYKHPVYNSAIEPLGKMKIVNYFTNHLDLDGARNVIDILNESS